MKITVDKAELLETLRTNREAHADLFQKAIEKYRSKAIEHFSAQIDKIKAGGEVETYLRLPVPEEHTDDYDRVIEMLAWDTGDLVELDDGQFRQYVLDQWGWHQAFVSNTTSYVA